MKCHRKCGSGNAPDAHETAEHRPHSCRWSENVGKWENISTYCLLVRSFVRLTASLWVPCVDCAIYWLKIFCSPIPLRVCVCGPNVQQYFMSSLLFSWISIRTRSFARTLPHIHRAHLPAAHLNFVWKFFFIFNAFARASIFYWVWLSGESAYGGMKRKENFQFVFFFTTC